MEAISIDQDQEVPNIIIKDETTNKAIDSYHKSLRESIEFDEDGMLK